MLQYLETQVVFREVPNEIALAINISGCPCRCEGCHSPQLWKDEGTPLMPSSLESLVATNPGISCVAFMGGDAYPNEVAFLSDYIKTQHPGLKTCWYSGRELAAVRKYAYRFNYLKVGPYIKDKGPLDSPTTNQAFYKVSRVDGEVLLEDISALFLRPSDRNASQKLNIKHCTPWRALTPKQIKALTVLERHPDITARKFGELYFNGPEHDVLHTAMSNQGNGACAGKKAWLCAGSLLGRLKKQDWVDENPFAQPRVFRLTDKGRQLLQDSCTPGVCRICGCTDDNACYNPSYGNCWWVDDAHTLCSHCVMPDVVRDPKTKHPNTHSNGHKSPRRV